MIETALVILTLVAFLAGLVAVAVFIFRWARRTGRRPWVWLVGAYIAANILVGFIRWVFTGQP